MTAAIPAGARATAVPDVLFTDALPLLADDALAVGAALYAVKLVQAKRGTPRYITEPELRADTAFARYAAAAGRAPSQLADALVRVVDAGVLITLDVAGDDGPLRLYFLNTTADRRGREIARREGAPAARIAEGEQPAVRSSVFSLYESLIGTVSPLIADELAEAERLYPAEWLGDAFREAAAHNARNWRYISRILERWAREGRADAKAQRNTAGEGRYFRGKYGRILRRRLDR